jgi:hypothetical protein
VFFLRNLAVILFMGCVIFFGGYHRNSLQEKNIHDQDPLQSYFIGLLLDLMTTYVSNSCIKNCMLKYFSLLNWAYDMMQGQFYMGLDQVGGIFLSLILHEYESFEGELFPPDPYGWYFEVLLSFEESSRFTSESIGDEEF